MEKKTNSLFIFICLMSTTMLSTSNLWCLSHTHSTINAESWDFVNVIGSIPRTFTAADNAEVFTPISSLVPSWNGAQKFGISFWSKRSSYADTEFHSILRLANTK